MMPYRDLGTLHSPQHKGYPDASSRPLPPSEGETLPDLQPTPVLTAEGHSCTREKDQLRARIEWLENRLQQREETVSDLMDEAEGERQIAGQIRAELYEVFVAAAVHARTLDDRALGHPDRPQRDRDAIDNDLYNVARAVDPERWDKMVPGLNGCANS